MGHFARFKTTIFSGFGKGSADNLAVHGPQVIFITGRIAAYYAEAFRQSCDLEIFEIHSRMCLDQFRGMIGGWGGGLDFS